MTGRGLTGTGRGLTLGAMPHQSPHPDLVIPAVTLTDYVLDRAWSMGDKPALIDGPSGRVVTYAHLQSQVRSFAGGLVERGFKAGQVVALMLPNIPEFAVCFYGTLWAGGVVTTVNPAFTAEECRHQLADSGAVVAITIPGLLETVSTAAEGTSVDEIFVVGEAEAVRPITDLFAPELAIAVARDADALAVLPYSSGTTGRSKGVMLSHRNLVANAEQTISAVELREAHTYVAVLPFFHIYGLTVLMNCALRVGATVVTMPRFDLELFLELHQRYQVARSFVAPPIVLALAKHPVVDNYDLSSLEQIISGAAPLSAELAADAAQRLGCEVAQGYGMTELSPVTHITPVGRARPGSVGLAAPNTAVKIVDPASRVEVGANVDGEVCIHGPQVMLGYLNNAQATEAMIDPDGWLHTGDVGHTDDEGYLFVVDRIKELIKVKGFQVAPAELEALLLTHPSIADVAVIGRPDEESGEVPVAFVVVKPGAELSVADVQDFVAGHAAHYKQVRDVQFIDSVPKSPSGKIIRRLLRDQ